MENNDLVLEVLEACDKRREDRRRFIKVAGATSAAVAGGAFLSACSGNNNDGGGTFTPIISASLGDHAPVALITRRARTAPRGVWTT